MARELRSLGSSAEVQENSHISYVSGVRGRGKPRCASQSSLRGDASANGGPCSAPRLSVKAVLSLHCITAHSCKSFFKAWLPQGVP